MYMFWCVYICIEIFILLIFLGGGGGRGIRARGSRTYRTSSIQDGVIFQWYLEGAQPANEYVLERAFRLGPTNQFVDRRLCLLVRP